MYVCGTIARPGPRRYTLSFETTAGALVQATQATADRYGHWLLPAAELQQLIDALQQAGYQVLGPVVKDAVVVIGNLSEATQLPRGIRTIQHGGHYRTSREDDPSYFGFHHGADSWKPRLFPSRRLLFELGPDLIATSRAEPEPSPMAFFGVRACDLKALQVQAKVFSQADPGYLAQLESSFVIGVHCQSAASTCFCPSAGSGPEFSDATFLDLVVTEIVEREAHYFIVTAHSDRGAFLLEPLELAAASKAQVQQVDAQLSHTRGQIETRLPKNSRALLQEHPDAAHWDDVAERCLSCGNCTAVCPTCFCSDVEDHTELGAQTAQRWQVWDSCFNPGHSYTHAGTVRESTRARYRQWLTHKLSTWHDQFDTSGCTGCGRCITWCPVGIDLTAEVAAIAAEVANEH